MENIDSYIDNGLPFIQIRLAESNIIDNDSGLHLRCASELVDDVKDMYGIDITNEHLLATVKKYGKIVISLKKEND